VVPTLRRMRRKALAGVMADKAVKGKLVIMQLPDTAMRTTKEVTQGLFDNATHRRRGILIVLDSSNASWMQPFRNIRGIRVALVQRFTLQQAIEANVIWVDEKSLPVLESRCVY
jgi:ribosomal protein L4